jgi:ATP-dependent DNA ligase
VQLLTRTGLDWTAKYPSAIAALANLNVKTAYLDGELCGVDDAGLPSFAQTQAATDGERDVHLVYYAFDLLHIGGWDVSGLSLVEHKALLEPLVTDKPGLQYNGHDTGDGELILKHAGKLSFEGVVSKTIDAPYAPGNRGLWRKAKALNRQEFVVVGWSDPEGDIADRDEGRRIWRIAGVDLTSALGWTTVVAATADLRHSRKIAQRRHSFHHDGDLLGY